MHAGGPVGTVRGVTPRTGPSIRTAAIAIAVGLVAAVVWVPGPAAAKAGRQTWGSLCNGTAYSVATPFAAGLNCREAAVGGITRRYVAWVPDAVAASADPVPAVFMFHGSTGTGEQFFKISGWREVADQEGLIAVFPTGAEYKITGKNKRSTKWHSYDLACDVDEGVTPLRDDVGLTDGILDDIIASEQLDEDRVYASGFSDGAQFAQRLAFERGDRFAAVTSWSGFISPCASAPASDALPTPAANPAPSWAGIGSKDDRAFVPGVTELPMNPAVMNVYFNIALTNQTAAHGLDRGTWVEQDFATWNGWVQPVAAWPDPEWTVMEWTTLDTGTEPTEFVFSILEGVKHHYPNARPGAAKSSSYVNFAEVSWIWFEPRVRD